MKYRYEVRERQNAGAARDRAGYRDPLFSRHRTLVGAERVIAKARRRAQAWLGRGAYTTLYIVDLEDNT